MTYTMEQYRHPYWKHHRWPQDGVCKIEFLRGFFPSHSNPNVRIYSHEIKNFEKAGKILYLYLLALQSRIPSMIEAWFKLSDITASSYKHRIYRENQRKISYLIENNFKNTSIGVKASCIQNSIFGIVHFCNLLLQFQVNFLCSTNKSSRTETSTILFNTVNSSFDNIWMSRKTEIIVCTEINAFNNLSIWFTNSNIWTLFRNNFTLWFPCSSLLNSRCFCC